MIENGNGGGGQLTHGGKNPVRNVMNFGITMKMIQRFMRSLGNNYKKFYLESKNDEYLYKLFRKIKCITI